MLSQLSLELFPLFDILQAGLSLLLDLLSKFRFPDSLSRPIFQHIRRLPPHLSLELCIRRFSTSARLGLLYQFQLLDERQGLVQTSNMINQTFFQCFERLSGQPISRCSQHPHEQKPQLTLYRYASSTNFLNVAPFSFIRNTAAIGGLNGAPSSNSFRHTYPLWGFITR